jgi:hypothetical protein
MYKELKLDLNTEIIQPPKKGPGREGGGEYQTILYMKVMRQGTVNIRDLFLILYTLSMTTVRSLRKVEIRDQTHEILCK